MVGSSEIILHNATNRPPVDFQFLTVLNLGAGVMNWEVQVSELWIIVSQMNGQDDQPLLIQADPTGLPVGVYEGTLTIGTTRAARNGPLAPASVQETVTVSVILVVLPVQLMPVYLPVVVR